MTREIEDRARHLASQPYAIEIRKDKTTTGEDVFLAENPDLYGCMAQGATIEEALSNLADARLDYIETLLVDGEPVPDVVSPSVYTSGETETVCVIDETIQGEGELASGSDKATQRVGAEHVLKIEPVVL
ncbi:MAG: type II toxin-antitoxin system HicB family antitoxin [Chloroflexota bacterium]|nr:type II toxin-antitoxin system HicB family antitoxin [Chloroflexota bacterium]